MGKELLFGAVYIIEQDYTDEEIRRDMQNMKDIGFNLITLWPVGNAWLARSSHEWVFTKTRFVLDICEELGIKAVLQLFGQNQAQEFMPDSASTPEMEYSDQYGPWINSNCMWANLNHPVVRDYFDNYFREAITALKDHPALYGWDVFNEAHFRSDDPWTVRYYQDWLKEKYGDIRKLNHEWYRRYESFHQIRPEKRRAPYSIWSSLLPSIEYEKFRSVNTTDICRFLYETAKKYDDIHPIIIDGTSSAVMSADVTMRNNDEFETAKVPDIYGSTFYPKSWGRNYKDTPWTLSMYFSVPAGAARQQGKPYFVDELQTHTQSVLTPGSEVKPNELVNWTLMCIFTGTAGMQLWRWRPFLHGYQSTGRGLTLMDGTPNERAFAVRDLMKVIHEHEDIFGNFTVSAPSVTILESYDVRLYFDALLKFGEGGYGSAGESFWPKNAEGWYRLFWNRGLQIEFRDLSAINKTLPESPVTVLPGAIRISEKEAEGLCRYVEEGGILIADGRMGCLDEKACVPPEGIPGKRLSGLFGIVEVDVDSELRMQVGDEKVAAGFQSQKLKILDNNVKVLASMEDGTPAITEKTYGKGKAIYCNSFLGLVLKEGKNPQLENILWNECADRIPEYVTKGTRTHVARINAGDHRAMLTINFGDSEETFIVHGLPAAARLTNIMKNEEITSNASGDAVGHLLPGEQAVWVTEVLK